MYTSLISKYSPNFLLENEDLCKHTSFKIGGPADIFLTPDTPQLLQEMISLIQAKNYRYMIIGGGNNLLFSDNGFRGIIISTEKLNKISRNNTQLTVLSGTSLKELTNYCLENSLSGLEFACGIPGSVGGAIFMNAGAYGGEMKDVVTKVLFLDNANKLCTYQKGQHNFSYRNSIYQENNYLVLEVTYELKTDPKTDIAKTMQDLQEKREAKQPLEYPSAGSVFRRPQGYFVGKLIDDCGLRGFSIGGAQISEKHSGFIINKGNATAQDVKNLINHIKETVKCKFGVELQTEVRIIKNDGVTERQRDGVKEEEKDLHTKGASITTPSQVNTN